MTQVTHRDPDSKHRRSMPAWLIGLMIAIAVLVAGLLAANALGFGDDPTIDETDAAASNEAVASDDAGADTDGLTFTYFDGTQGSFEDLRGQPVVINFWASWCPACVAELPDFEHVHGVLGDEVQFVGMNLSETDRSSAEKLLAETGVTYTLAEDPDGTLYASFDGIAMPTSVFIDAEGNIVYTHSGVVFAADLEKKLREVFDL